MQLINRVEISYFRSIYKEKLNGLNGTNIIFGRNDSGKSNVLRALNLFFNNETNPNQIFTFDRDFCDARKMQSDTQDSIRKFVYIKLWITTPKNWYNSLGRGFWVKKQWSIGRLPNDPHFESSIQDDRKQQYLTRFLNNIRFHYIPAIKDRRIFEQLLYEIYQVLAQQEEFNESLNDFAAALRQRTTDLTHTLFSALGINSIISPPEDLSDLFRSLDFETSESENGQSQTYSLKLQRGDGVQVQHIPEILSFISDRSPEDFHVWGFEEPENSLELANAIEEASKFCKYGNESNKQIFVTSHSPAFFNCTSEKISRYFVFKKTNEIVSELIGNKIKTSKVDNITKDIDQYPSDLMGETPHLRVISQYLYEADQKIKKIKNQGKEVDNLLQELNKPIVFVEGDSDKIIVETAWNLFFGNDQPFDIISCNGTTKMKSLSEDGLVLHKLSPNRKVFVIVDNDKEGRELYSNGKLETPYSWVQHNSNKVFWCRLPFVQSFQEFFQSNEINEKHWPGIIENIFSPTIRIEAEREGVYQIDKTKIHDELNSYIANILPYIKSDAKEIYYIYPPHKNYKLPFAQWVKDNSSSKPEMLEPFKKLLEGLNSQLS